MLQPPIVDVEPRIDALPRNPGLYLDLMKRCLTHSLWYDAEDEIIQPRNLVSKTVFSLVVRPFLKGQHRHIYKRTRRRKIEGRCWPQFAHTMIGFPRLNSLQSCVERVIQEDIPGDFIETGVWRGGACIFMRAILQAYGITDRSVWVADSFQGLPAPNVEKAPADETSDLHTYADLAISLETVKSNFEAYGLLDEQVKFLKGWFKDTLPTIPKDQRFALCRLDGDMYESTMDSLSNLYPKLSIGGYLIIDDYGVIQACRQAVTDFRARHNITETIETIDWSGRYWRRER